MFLNLLQTKMIDKIQGFCDFVAGKITYNFYYKNFNQDQSKNPTLLNVFMYAC